MPFYIYSPLLHLFISRWIEVLLRYSRTYALRFAALRPAAYPTPRLPARCRTPHLFPPCTTCRSLPRYNLRPQWPFSRLFCRLGYSIRSFTEFGLKINTAFPVKTISAVASFCFKPVYSITISMPFCSAAWWKLISPHPIHLLRLRLGDRAHPCPAAASPHRRNEQDWHPIAAPFPGCPFLWPEYLRCPMLSAQRICHITGYN